MSNQNSTAEPFIVLVDAPIPPDQAEKIRRLSPRIELVNGYPEAALAEAQVVFTGKAAFDPAKMPKLRWVQLNTVAINQILHQPIASANIPIANVRGAYAIAVAELTIGLLLALLKRFPAGHRLQLQSQWPNSYLPLKGENCYGKTVGIVGYGSIGRHVARIAQAMGMQVLACKRRPDLRQDSSFCLPTSGDPAGIIPQQWFGIDRLTDMLSMVDVAVVTLPQTPATDKIIGRRELAALPPHAYLINVGRGAVLDEPALIDHLQAGKLAGAALDVFATEPLPPDSPLWQMPNVLAMPHIGSYTQEQAPWAAEVLVENLARDLRGESLINLVDMSIGY